MTSFNFKIYQDGGPISQMLQARQITDFKTLCEFVQSLPYGRTSDRQQPELVLLEKKEPVAANTLYSRQ